MSLISTNSSYLLSGVSAYGFFTHIQAGLQLWLKKECYFYSIFWRWESIVKLHLTMLWKCCVWFLFAVAENASSNFPIDSERSLYFWSVFHVFDSLRWLKCIRLNQEQLSFFVFKFYLMSLFNPSGQTPCIAVFLIFLLKISETW